jgi:hypothetical protein
MKSESIVDGGAWFGVCGAMSDECRNFWQHDDFWQRLSVTVEDRMAPAAPMFVLQHTGSLTTTSNM